MVNIVVEKQLIGAADLVSGAIPVTQQRAGVSVQINPVTAADIALRPAVVTPGLPYPVVQTTEEAIVALQQSVTAGGSGGIPLSQKGAANGVASLDAAGLIPAAQLPLPGIPLSQKGAANGVASLDAAGLIPAAQLPASQGSVTKTSIDTGLLRRAGMLNGQEFVTIPVPIGGTYLVLANAEAVAITNLVSAAAYLNFTTSIGSATDTESIGASVGVFPSFSSLTHVETRVIPPNSNLLVWIRLPSNLGAPIPTVTINGSIVLVRL